MRKIPVEEAVGQTLCHDMTAILANGFKGVKFKRGHVVTEEDIPELLNIGKSHIFVWEPGAGEVHEEDAARAVTEAACGPNIAFTGPSEGKFQLLADADGLFCVNSGALRRINSVPDFTIACRPGNTAVRKGEKLGGARIVPLMTRRENVERAVEAAGEGTPVFQIKPFLSLKTSIVITGSEVYYGRIEDRFEPILREKLGAYGARILSVQKCPDDLDRLSEALDRCVEEGAELVLLTGGMSVDPDDLTPTAIRMSGAELVTQGVPMQPGNMLTMAYLGDTMLIGVPGASMHSKITSLDIFLPRIFAGERITKEEIPGLGEGGFCMGCRECRYPLCYFGRN